MRKVGALLPVPLLPSLECRWLHPAIDHFLHVSSARVAHRCQDVQVVAHQRPDVAHDTLIRVTGLTLSLPLDRNQYLVLRSAAHDTVIRVTGLTLSLPLDRTQYLVLRSSAHDTLVRVTGLTLSLPLDRNQYFILRSAAHDTFI